MKYFIVTTMEQITTVLAPIRLTGKKTLSRCANNAITLRRRKFHVAIVHAGIGRAVKVLVFKN